MSRSLFLLNVPIPHSASVKSGMIEPFKEGLEKYREGVISDGKKKISKKLKESLKEAIEEACNEFERDRDDRVQFNHIQKLAVVGDRCG